MNELKTIVNFHRLSHELGSAGQPSEEQLGEIAGAGYEVIVNLALHDRPYSLENEAAMVRDLGWRQKYHGKDHLPDCLSTQTTADTVERLHALLLARNLFPIDEHQATQGLA